MAMFELKELNMTMALPEYEMYQDIPLKEPGATNLCHGLPYEVFKDFLETQMARKYQRISRYDTPTIVYIMYADGAPVGYVGIRTEIDDNWRKWSGNLYYAVRCSARGKGYATKMVGLALQELKRMHYKEIYCQTSAGNVASSKVIEHNGGILLNEEAGTLYYKIVLG